MRSGGVLAGLLAASVVAWGVSAAADQVNAAGQRQPGAMKVVTRQVRVPSPQPPAPQPQQQAPFVPIVNGQLLAYYMYYPPSYSNQLLAAYGLLPPFGGYIYGSYPSANPEPFPPRYDFDRSRHLLIVVGPPDAPGATYYYYNAFPSYYNQPGYFPGGAYGGGGVTIVSPTVPQQAQPSRQPPVRQAPAAPQVKVPGGLERASFLSALAPMLGGQERVTLDFAVGEVKLHQGDYAAAAEALRRAVSAAPDRPAPKLALGLALTGSGDYGGAAQVVKRGLRVMPDWRVLKLDPGRVFGSQAAYQGVLAGLQGAPKADRDARFLLGFLYLASGSYAKAADQFALADQKDPLVVSLTQEARHQAAGMQKGASAPQDLQKAKTQ
jgi:Tetratricopeptide repeat